jgi:hypothetical protein
LRTALAATFAGLAPRLKQADLPMRLEAVMTPTSGEPTSTGAARGPGLAKAALALTAVVLLCYVPAGLIGSHLLKTSAWESAGLAAGVCWFSSLLGLCIYNFFRQAGNPLAAMLGATLVRTGIPLAAVVLIGNETYKGFVGFILVFYMVTLMADTLFAAAMNRSAMRARAEGRRHG